MAKNEDITLPNGKKDGEDCEGAARENLSN